MAAMIAVCVVRLPFVPADARVVQAAGEQAARRYLDRPVAEVLLALQSDEVRFIFSTGLVPPTLLVKAEPRGSDPVAIARQILEPHHLTLQPGPRGLLIIVVAPRAKGTPRRAPARAAPASPRGGAKPVAPEAEGEEAAGESALPIRISEQIDVSRRGGLVTVPAGAYVAASRTVREMAGGLENAFQVLPLLPGAVATNDDEGKLAVRGAGPEHNLVMFDGVPIHQVQRFGQFTSSFVNPATMASVSLDASGVEAQTGGRLSSVITLDTRDGRLDRSFALSGSAGLMNGDVLLEGRVPGTTSASWWATARGTHYRLFSDRFGETAMPGFGDLQAKVTFGVSPRARLSLFGLFGRETSRHFDRAREEGPGAPFRIVPVARVAIAHRIGSANLRWERPRLASITTLSLYSTNGLDEQQRQIVSTEPLERRTTLRDIGLRQRIVSSVARRHAIDAGVELRHVRSSWFMKGVKPPQWWRGIGPGLTGELVEYRGRPIDTRLRRTLAGAWLQDRVALAGGRIAIEPGVRVDWNSFTGETAWQPRLRVSARAGDTAIWVNASTQAQTPSHESMQGFAFYLLDGDRTDTLRNARSRQVAAGVERALGRGVSLRAEAYHRRFDRLLVQRLETDGERAARLLKYVIPDDLPPGHVILEHRPTVYPETIGRGRASGVELLLQRAGARAAGWFGYTWSRSTREMWGRTAPFDFDRPHALSAAATLRLTRRTQASATWQWASGFPITPVIEEVAFSTTVDRNGQTDGLMRAWRDPRTNGFFSMPHEWMRRIATYNGMRLSHYTRTDLRLTYATLGRWELYGELINAFNARNFRQERIQEGAPASYDAYSTMPRMPTFGVRATF